MDTAKPSQFWQHLANEHQRDLELFGFHRFKRHQALRYFTWQWRWHALSRSEQLRFLLRHTTPLEWLRCALEPVDVSAEAWEGVSWSRGDRWLYAFAIRLLWTYAAQHGAPEVLRLHEPALGDPFPVSWKGRLISQDLANSALEIATISRCLCGRVPESILEIGAGYGRSAYPLLSLFPHAAYTIVDIEPAITISRRYLSQLFPGRIIRFLTPDDVDQLGHGSADLAISVSSLQEMTPDQVAVYLGVLDDAASGGLVYLKQWSTWRNRVDNVTVEFDAYPVPRRWRLLSKARAPVQTRFIEACWSVPA